ncbi:hypothetical protein ACFSM5_14525 [Lacibacterium aquatile]|uniref:Uncharacterized protein n=1 Tax=Lacibacterium aquatile TaxID=1168082 RepID=A0ABW5DSH9_9PROT
MTGPQAKQPSNNDQKPPLQRSLVVRFWAQIFDWLSWFSLSGLLKIAGMTRFGCKFVAWRNKKLDIYQFIELYVMLHAGAAFAAMLLMGWGLDRYLTENPNRTIVGQPYWVWAVAIYAIARIFEVTVAQINMLLFAEYLHPHKEHERKVKAQKKGESYETKPYAVRGFRRTVILLLHNYFEVICWFSVIYAFLLRSGMLEMADKQLTLGVLTIFRQSLLLMFTLNTDAYKVVNEVAVFALSCHGLVGLLMTLMVMARFLSLLPTPETLDEFENGASPKAQAYSGKTTITQTLEDPTRDNEKQSG